MSPPHNGTPFIYFTERLSLVISTALKSYYLYFNDEWIECGCQEQYLFVSCGQPWLLFNSISPPALSVIDNWCGPTSLSEDAESRKPNHTVGYHLRVFTRLVLCCFRRWRVAVTDDELTLMRSLGREPSEITKPLHSFKMLHDAQTQWHLARATQYCLCALVSSWIYAGLDCFLFMSLFLTQAQIVSVCCRLTTQAELKGCGSYLRAVSIGFRGTLCINLPEEKSKQALAGVSLSRLQILVCGFIHTYILHWLNSRCSISARGVNSAQLEVVR